MTVTQNTSTRARTHARTDGHTRKHARTHARTHARKHAHAVNTPAAAAAAAPLAGAQLQLDGGLDDPRAKQRRFAIHLVLRRPQRDRAHRRARRLVQGLEPPACALFVIVLCVIG